MAVSDYKIKDSDLQGKGISDQPRFPDLKTPDMQRKFDELVLDVVKPKYNSLVDEIDGNYATKRYVGEQMAEAGAGDMAKAIYDTDNDGSVDSADVSERAKNGIDEYTHLKQETVHRLRNENGTNNIMFYATADYEAGDTFEVNGVVCTAQTTDGSSLVGGAFKTGAGVFCLKVGTVLVFQGGMPTSAAMHKSGGTFSGQAFAYSTNRIARDLRNISVRDSGGTGVSTCDIVMNRK